MNSFTKKRIATLGVVAVGSAALLFGVSVAQPIIAKAGGSGDFYKYNTCKATRYGETISGLQGILSNYDIHNFADQRYHHGVSITRAGWYLAAAPLYDDESWPISQSEIWDAIGSSGYKFDGYQDFDYKAGQHTVTFIFGNGNITAKCSIRQ